MDYSDLQFHNVQLMKLVSSAEILFQHLYELVSTENKAFISQWLCYKQEYDGDSNSQFDINENVQECPALTRIDEVSENEKISSISSVSASSSNSSISSENAKKNLNEATAHENGKSFETSTLPSVDNHVSQTDADLLEYMTEFKLFTDGFMSDWFKTLSFNTSEIKQYMSWLEDKEFKKIWTNIYNNCRQKSELETRKRSESEPAQHVVRDDPERTSIPIETSHLQQKPSTDYLNLMQRNSTRYQNNVNVYHEEYVDQQIRYLQEIRHVLMFAREKLNTKFKKDELKSSVDFKNCLKVDVAFEIIDLSIEMKNQLKFGREIENLTLNDEVDTIIADCLRVLSLNEIRHLLITYLSNVIDMRKCSSENDKQVMKLDSEISNLKILLWRLSYENRCLTLHKEFEQKLQLMGKTTTDESNDESITNVQSRKLLSIVAKNELRESSQPETKNVQTAISCLPNIPERSLKTLQSTLGSTSSGTKVTRNKGKLIIHAKKH